MSVFSMKVDRKCTKFQGRGDRVCARAHALTRAHTEGAREPGSEFQRSVT